ncbi:unnamed protein product [Arabidopsis halleri]
MILICRGSHRPPVTYYRPFPFPAENRTHFPAKTYVERQNKRQIILKEPKYFRCFLLDARK